MEASLSALELNATIDERRQIQLDEPLPFDVPKRVRVIVLYASDDEISEGIGCVPRRKIPHSIFSTIRLKIFTPLKMESL